MIRQKKSLALLLAALLALSLTLAACSTDDPPPPAPTTPVVTDQPVDSPGPVDSPAPVLLSTARDGAIDFADKNFSFIAIDEAPGNASENVSLSVAEFMGEPMLKIEVGDGDVPYVAIDASSLLGDRISDLRTMELTVATVHPDGNFYATSGNIIGYCGTARNEVKKPWSVYVDSRNPNIARFEMTKDSEFMVAGNHNFFVFSVDVDNGKAAGRAVVYIGNICFLDANGDVLPVNTNVDFDAPAGFGQMDTSNLWGVVGGGINLGLSGSSSGWGQAISIETDREDGPVLTEWFTEGCIVTVYYSSENPPELILQSWSDGRPDTSGWAKVEPFAINDSGTIAQFKFDDMVASFGSDEFDEFLDKFNIGDTDAQLDVSMVTIGTGVANGLVAVTNEREFNWSGSSAGWGQAVTMDTLENDGEFDPAILVPGTVVTVWFTSANPPELILQSWTDGRPDTSGWAKIPVGGLNFAGDVAQYLYDDMVEIFGTDDFEQFVDKFYIGDTGVDLSVSKVSFGVQG